MYPEFRITTHFGLQPLAVLFFFSAVSLWCLKFYLNQSIWSAKQKIQDPPSCFSHAHPCTHPSGRKHASASILSFILFLFSFFLVCVRIFCFVLWSSDSKPLRIENFPFDSSIVYSIISSIWIVNARVGDKLLRGSLWIKSVIYFFFAFL